MLGRELGADDYITKPFGHQELVARVDAVRRRTERGTLLESRPRVLAIGSLRGTDLRYGTGRSPGRLAILAPPTSARS